MDLQVNGISMFYQELGEGFPLVLIHGFPLDHTIWGPMFPLLRSEARIIAPDLRGFGRSDAPEGTYTMDQMAEDISSLLDHLKIEKAILAGHSMGGYIALAFARLHPEKLAGLGMVSSQAGADTPETRANRLATARKVTEEGVPTVADKLAEQLSPVPVIREKVRSIILNTKPAGIAGALKGMAERPDSIPFLREIKIPATIIAGTKDELIPVVNSRMMLQTLPYARWVEIEDASHMAMMETPAIVADELKQLVLRVV